jgi:ABC-type branched-subunit amino acid transport system ATPase component
MKLINFQIKNYKVIADTDPVKVDPRVTALVGKNESGKTAVLKAMWKTRNVADAAFDKLYDYPRDRYSREPSRSAHQDIGMIKHPDQTDYSGAVFKPHDSRRNISRGLVTNHRCDLRYRHQRQPLPVVAARL